MQHEGDNCYLSFAVMILEHCKEKNRPAWSWSPISLVSWWPAHWNGWSKAAALPIFQLLSPIRAILQRPQCLPWAGDAHCGSCSSSTSENIKALGVVLLGRIAPGPQNLLRDTWAHLSQQLRTAKPTFSPQIPPLGGWWLMLANFILRLGSFLIWRNPQRRRIRPYHQWIIKHGLQHFSQYTCE